MEIHGIQSIHSVQPAAKSQPSPVVEQPEKKLPTQAPDEYIPEDKSAHEPIGLYRVGYEDGVPKIEFDDPEAKTEQTTTDTDKVDREIEQLKRKQEQLAQKAQRETNPQRKEQLERELSQVEQELSQKDNDTYRRQHAEISFTEIF